MKKPLVSIVMGSDSDMDLMKAASGILKEFGVSYELRILSAHRSPDAVARFAKDAFKRGLKVIIAGAGGAAHLAGVIASHTTLPVIGVPIETKSLKGLDSLLSTVQMPKGVPVGCMAVGKSGAENAALFALKIIGLNNRLINQRLIDYKKKLSMSVIHKDRKINENPAH